MTTAASGLAEAPSGLSTNGATPTGTAATKRRAASVPVDHVGITARMHRGWKILVHAIEGTSLAALAVIALYSFGTEGRHARTLAFLLLIGLAACAAGAFFGFLFGVPRSSTNSGTVANLDPDKTQPNTNLEQISDWLTKILVGATLVELGSIAPVLERLFRSLGTNLGTGDTATPIVGCLMVYSALAGFVLGWIGARAALPYLIYLLRLPKEDQSVAGESRATNRAHRGNGEL